MNRKWTMLVLAGISSALTAKDIRIVTPYFGVIENKLMYRHQTINRTMEMEDSAPVGGLYVQWIDPGRYQWNVFIYGSQDINKSDILGSHFILDVYPFEWAGGKTVFGAGLDCIRIDTDGNVSPVLSNFKMVNRIYAPYIRAGQYVYLGDSMHKLSLLPWAGVEMEYVRGDMSYLLNLPGIPPIPDEAEIDEEDRYTLLGLNAKFTLYHFIELSAKYYYKISMNESENLHTFSAMCNLYLSRRIGLSYRFKSIEVSVSKNTYHIGGVAWLF